jgi:superfamily I DNA and/or RNA helicase
MNVALTRARTGVIVVGDKSTLASDPYWRAYVKWVEQRGCLVGADWLPEQVAQEHQLNLSKALAQKWLT